MVLVWILHWKKLRFFIFQQKSTQKAATSQK
jgi:hypothetical protein